MIKCNVTLIGTISRDGEIKKDREGKEFITFGVSTVVQASQGINKTIDVSVAMDADSHSRLEFIHGERIKLSGTLTFKKRDDFLYYNLSAKDAVHNPTEEDGITGSMSFRGTLGGKEITEKKGKKGSFIIFDGYSSEKVDENQYAYTWVHFIDFSGNRPEWLIPKTAVDAEGELELSVFNDRVNLTCRVTSLSLWEKQVANQ